MRLPPGQTADWAAHAYLGWLPRFLWPMLRVEGDADSTAAIRIRGTSLTLLELCYSPERSTPDRALLYVTGGMLAVVQSPVRGRLELRTVLDGRTTALRQNWIFRAGDEATLIQGSCLPSSSSYT